MDIGVEKPAIVVEPLEDPFTETEPAPEREREPLPEREREPVPA